MKVTITDHALLRYLQRGMGIPIEDLRAQLAATPGLAEACAVGARTFYIDGLSFRLKSGGYVVTVEEGTSQQATLKANEAKRGGGRARHVPKWRGKRARMQGRRPYAMEPAE